MIRAYVIKNKEGKYLDDCGFFTRCVKDIYLYEYYEDADKSIKFYNLTDCTIVPITIYEGDPLELACEKISSWEMNMPKDKMKDYFIQQAKESEKDE